MALDHFAPIESGDKIEQIVRVLKELIIDEKLEPGSELPPERQLAAQLKVSRYSLREALRAAQAHGLIELSQGRRPRVSTPSTDAVAEVFGIAMQRSKVSLSELITARISLECDIAAIAARKANVSLVAMLEANTQEMESHKDDLDQCVRKDLEFHDALVTFTGNVVFKTMLDSVASHLRASRMATLRLTGIDRALVGHRAIIKALRGNDPQEAHDAMHAHLEMAEDDIAEIEQRGTWGGPGQS